MGMAPYPCFEFKPCNLVFDPQASPSIIVTRSSSPTSLPMDIVYICLDQGCARDMDETGSPVFQISELRPPINFLIL